MRHPEKMRYMDQLASEARQNRVALKKAFRALWRRHLHAGEILRQAPDFTGFLRRPHQEVLVVMIETGERANDVARIGAHAELRDPANVDGNLH